MYLWCLKHHHRARECLVLDGIGIDILAHGQ